MTIASEEYYIIVPAEATNEVTNPSFELATTGYTASGAGVSIARSSAYQRRGVWSLEITPATGVESGVYFGTVSEVSGTTKTFSADVKGVAGQAMTISIRDTSGNSLSSASFTATGYWQRVKITRTGNANASRRLYILRGAVASTAKIYVDGFYYSTVDGTYLDGDACGFVRGATEYRWLGTPHASQSWRSGTTRSGGTMLRIKDYATILTVLGLGMASVTNIATPTPLDYSSYQTSRVNGREVIFNLAITGTWDEMRADRAALISAVKPDATPVKQPLVIRYQGLDANGYEATEPLDVKAHYVDGLDNEPTTPGAELPMLRFNTFLPFLSTGGASGKVLGYQTSVSNFANIGYRDTDGIWKAMGTGASGGEVDVFAVGPDGSIYAGGQFTGMGGVATTGYVARWNGSAWNALPTGLNGLVRALAFGPDGALYVGGTFTATLGGTTLNNIGKWDGANWTGLGSGTVGVNNSVYALAFGSDGALYVGGSFTTAGGSAANRVAKWNGTAWSALGSGISGGVIPVVYALAFGKDGTLYAGGNYTTADAVTVNNIAKWNGTAWSALGTGVNLNVYTLAVGQNGTLYAGGIFTQVSGAAISYIAGWNGVGWSSLGGGVSGGGVMTIVVEPNSGVLHVGGAFTSAGGATMPDRVAAWTNNTWMPLDVNLQDGSAYVYAMAFDKAGRLYLGGSWSGTTALSATVTSTNLGSARAYPSVTWTGPGTVYQLKNYTTGKSIFFNGLTLQAGETATLDLTPGAVSFVSSFRGNLANYLLAGSDFDWYLIGGANNVSTYMLGTTAASKIEMTWSDLYWSVDGARH